MKRLSVCMPLYNGAAYFHAQISSILSQLDENDELVIADDGSTDDSLTIIAAFDDARIRVVAGAYKKHPAYNLERALVAAEGNYLFLCDQDDVWEPNKVEVVLNYLKTYTLVLHDCKIVDANLKEIAPSFYALNGERRGFVANFLRNGYLGCCMAFRRQLLSKVLPFPAALPMHDSWLGLNALLWYDAVHIPDKLVLYRRHGANASSTSVKSKYSIWQQIRFRLQLMKGLFLTVFRKKLN